MSFTINEQSSGRYTGTLVDELGVGFGAVTTLTLKLYDKFTGTIINGRDTQNVLNTAQVTLDNVTGAIVWNLLPADNPIINPGLKTEDHVALFVAKWSAGAKELTHEVVITVKNLSQLP